MDLLNEMRGGNVLTNVRINVQIKDFENLTENEKQILDIIVNNPQITQASIANQIKTTPKTVQRGIATLKKNRIIERVGSNKKGYWKIIGKEET